MSEHTRGPWHVENTEAICVRSADGTRLCTINWLRGRNWAGGRIPDAEGEANARLIASAPDLLSIAKRWCALDAGSWHVDRHQREKAELLKDTADIIARAMP